jgi:trimeric autotransporter adhesin
MTHAKKTVAAVALCLLLWTAGASLSLAQIKSGSIVGSVTDKTGGVIPGAEVSAVNEETNVSVKVRSDSDGQYTVPYLAPGRYTLRVAKEGFSGFTQIGIALTAGQEARVDAQLELGLVRARVEVEAPMAILQTQSGSAQSSLSSGMIEATPNITDNPLYLTQFMPEVQGTQGLLSSQSAQSFGIGYEARERDSAFGVNGGQAAMTNITVDGVNVMSPEDNDAVALPNSDDIQEMKVMANNYSAQYGRGQGAVVIITKSGTNQFHGSVYDQLRNAAFNANSFSNNALDVAKPAFTVDYFGGTFGGPIKKNKLFFFASYEGMRHHTEAQWLASVPTPLEKAGNFSQTLENVNGVPTPAEIFNPFSVTQVAPDLYQRAQVPNAVIQNPNPVALKLLSNYPNPNRTPIDVYNDDNYFSQGIQAYDKDDGDARVDYQMGRNSIYGSGGISHGSILTPGPWGASVPYWSRETYPSDGPPPIVTDKNPYFELGDTIVLNPTMLVDLRVGVQRVNSQWATPLYPNFNYNALDIPADIQAIFPLPGVPPNVEPSLWTALSSTNADHKHTFMTDYDPAASLTKVIGKWTLIAGTEYVADFFADPNLYEGSVTYNESVNDTQYVNAFGDTTPQDITTEQGGLTDAAFLEGAGSLGITPGQSVKNASLDTYYALYSQNNWRATSRLTINLGLRWDVQPAATERYNRLSAFDPSKTNVWGTAGVLVFAGTDGYSRNLWNTHYRDFGPRLGAAYQLTNTLVVRGGYGITYIPANTDMDPGPYNFGMAPFSTYTTQIPYGTSPDGVPIGTFSDPAVSLPVTGPGANPAAPANYGTGVSLFPRRDFLDGRIQQWNVFFEKRLRGWNVSLGYVGTHGGQMPVARTPMVSEDLLPQSIDNCYRNGVNCSAKDSGAVDGNGYVQTGVDPGEESVPNPWNPDGTLPFGGALASSTIPRYVADSQYPMFDGDVLAQSYGFSNYNSGIVEVKHNFSQGLELDANAEWSKDMDFTGIDASMNGQTGGLASIRARTT